MRKNIVRTRFAQLVAVGVVATRMAPVAAQNRAEGKLEVEGKPVDIIVLRQGAFISKTVLCKRGPTIENSAKLPFY